jgi:hypothetical protein
MLECVWNLMADGDTQEKWRGNWRMEWVASTLTLPRNVVYPALLTLTRMPQLPAVNWTEAPADLNGLVHFGERRNLVSAYVPSHFKRTIPISTKCFKNAPLFHLFYTSMKLCCPFFTFCSILNNLQSILWRAAIMLLLTLYLLRYFYAVLMPSSIKMLLDIHFFHHDYHNHRNLG